MRGKLLGSVPLFHVHCNLETAHQRAGLVGENR